MQNEDKMLEAILREPKLMGFGKYCESDITTVDDALESDNVVIHTTAIIIRKSEEDASPNEIYKNIRNYLTTNIE